MAGYVIGDLERTQKRNWSGSHKPREYLGTGIDYLKRLQDEFDHLALQLTVRMS